MIFNLFQRPEVRPGKEAVYDWQRKVGHDLGLKATVFIGSNQLTDPEVVEKCRIDRDEFGDEIGIWLAPDEQAGGNMIWLVSEEDKLRSIKNTVENYKKAFGSYPVVMGNYVLDSSLIRIIKDCCPSVKAVVAGCFEEGVKVFHGCNNSWYLFSEGMSWNPWYPSKGHSVRPAESENDWAGVVAVPHLSRDLVFGYESRNDFFASHPANIQRGLANIGRAHDYDFNLCDQYRMQEDFNDGFSYYQIHVGSGWLSHNHNIIDPDEVTQALYKETLEYIASLRDEGKAEVMTFSEFADAYRKRVPIGKQDIGVGKDILMGSGKQYYWVYDTNYRALVDVFQGGSIGDLRPYAGKYDAFTGPDAPNGRYLMNSYPYLIQSQYRSGVKNHCFDGSYTTMYLEHGGEKLDMCRYNTKIEKVERTDNSSTLYLKPVEMKFDDGLEVTVQTVYRFDPAGRIGIIRRILSVSDPSAELGLQEYVKGCYGFTEYPEDMKNIDLYLGGEKVLDYTYANKSVVREGAGSAGVTIPEITTDFSLNSDTAVSAEVKEGHLFEPYYTLKLNYKVTADTKEVSSWLQIKKTQA